MLSVLSEPSNRGNHQKHGETMYSTNVSVTYSQSGAYKGLGLGCSFFRLDERSDDLQFWFIDYIVREIIFHCSAKALCDALNSRSPLEALESTTHSFGEDGDIQGRLGYSICGDIKDHVSLFCYDPEDIPSYCASEVESIYSDSGFVVPQSGLFKLLELTADMINLELHEFTDEHIEKIRESLCESNANNSWEWVSLHRSYGELLLDGKHAFGGSLCSNRNEFKFSIANGAPEPYCIGCDPGELSRAMDSTDKVSSLESIDWRSYNTGSPTRVECRVADQVIHIVCREDSGACKTFPVPKEELLKFLHYLYHVIVIPNCC